MITVSTPKIHNLNAFDIKPSFLGRAEAFCAGRPDEVCLSSKTPPVKKETLKKIKALKGPAVLNTGKITSILLEDKGLDPKLITPCSKTARFIKDNLTGKGDNAVAEFNLITGNLNITKGLVAYMSNIQYAAAIAHELDHFINCAKLCKTIGVDEYENIFSNTKNKNNFNRNFWIKAAKSVDVEGFDPKPIIENITSEQKIRFGYSGNMFAMFDYLNSPLEKSAYDVQYYIEDTLGEKPSFLSHRGVPELMEEINTSFDEAKERMPEISEFKSELIDFLYIDSLRFIHKPLMDLDKKISECVQKGEPTDGYIKKYNSEISKALLKMAPLFLNNIFTPQKCFEAEKTVLKRIKSMLDNAPLEQYLDIAAQKRLTMLQSINTKGAAKPEIEALEAEIKSVEEKIKKLAEK